MTVKERLTAVLAALSFLGVVAGAPASANPIDPPGVLTFSGLPRTYVVHAPPGRPPVALVLNLHGSGMTGADQAGLTGYTYLEETLHGV